MLLYPEYRPSSREAARHVRLTRRLAFVPIFVAITLMCAKGSAAGPGLWSAVGIGGGFALVLAGAWRIHDKSVPRGPLGDRLAATSDAWFPPLLFVSQNVFLLIPLTILWLTLVEQGFPAGAWSHLAVAVLMALIPAGRLLRRACAQSESLRLHLAERFLHALVVSIVALFVVSAIARFSTPSAIGGVTEQTLHTLTVMWAIGILIVVVSFGLFLDQAVRMVNAEKKKAQPAATAPGE